jgi:hypothetical protein
MRLTSADRHAWRAWLIEVDRTQSSLWQPCSNDAPSRPTVSRRGWAAAATGLLTPCAAALRARGRACGRSDMRIVPGAAMSRARWSGHDHAAAATTSTLEEPAARWSARDWEEWRAGAAGSRTESATGFPEHVCIGTMLVGEPGRPGCAMARRSATCEQQLLHAHGDRAAVIDPRRRDLWRRSSSARSSGRGAGPRGSRGLAAGCRSCTCRRCRWLAPIFADRSAP